MKMFKYLKARYGKNQGMHWEELTKVKELDELIQFEKSVYPPEDLSPAEDYWKWMQTGEMRIFLLKIKTKIVGTFQTLPHGDKIYMGGFAVAPEYQERGISNTVMKKLLEEFGDKPIICKTKAEYIPMRKVLLNAGFENNLDRFEEGRLWSWWVKMPEGIK